MLTTADCLRTPETNRVHELWRGVFRVEDSPTSWHQDLGFEIAIAIRAHVKPRELGKVWVAPLDVILDADRAIVLQPDVVFVSQQRPGIVTDKLRGPPIWWWSCCRRCRESGHPPNASSASQLTEFVSAGW